jgi:hypothetical protein
MQPAVTGIAKRPERHPQQDGRVENLSLVFPYAFQKSDISHCYFPISCIPLNLNLKMSNRPVFIPTSAPSVLRM